MTTSPRCENDGVSFDRLTRRVLDLSANSIVCVDADRLAATKAGQQLSIVHHFLAESGFRHASLATVAIDVLDDGLDADHGRRI